MSEDKAYGGFQEPETFGSLFNAHTFLIESILAMVHTSTLVKVVKCTNNGSLSAAGTVDVQPLVNQLDGYGNPVPHGIIYKCLYSRLQGGANAVIIDPQPGDIGAMIFSDRDTSKVIATKAQANPGSNRKFDMADGIYLGWCLNAVPTQFIEFSAAGITITSPAAVTINAPIATVNAPVSVINSSTSATVNAKDVRLHATNSYTEDVGGYGQKISNDGSGNITIDTYYTGAVVTTNAHAYNPPEIP